MYYFPRAKKCAIYAIDVITSILMRKQKISHYTYGGTSNFEFQTIVFVQYCLENELTNTTSFEKIPALQVAV